MQEFIFYTVIVALIASFIVLLLSKVGVLEWMQINGSEIISKLASCHFCLSFWIGLIVAVIFAVITANPILVLVPICSSPISRMLL